MNSSIALIAGRVATVALIAVHLAVAVVRRAGDGHDATSSKPPHSATDPGEGAATGPVVEESQQLGTKCRRQRSDLA